MPWDLGERGLDRRDVIDSGVRPGVALTQQIRQRLTRASLPVISERLQRVEPEPLLNVGAACSFSLWAVISVASRSMTNGRSALALWPGACTPARAQARARAAARAASIAFDVRGVSAARASIVRETVGPRLPTRLTAQHRDISQAVTTEG